MINSRDLPIARLFYQKEFQLDETGTIYYPKGNTSAYFSSKDQLVDEVGKKIMELY